MSDQLNQLSYGLKRSASGPESRYHSASPEAGIPIPTEVNIAVPAERLAIVRRFPLLTALLLSAVLHSVLFLPWPEQTRSTPAVPVINAELRQLQPHQQTLQSAAETIPARPSSPDIPQSPGTPPPAVPRQSGQALAGPSPGAHPATHQTAHKATPADFPARQAQPAQTGLTLTEDELSSDPPERRYQQRLLAHLREKLTAPAELNGSVRLSLTLSYRQIATEVQVIRSSGDPRLDDWAVKAVIAANPYPRVPDDLPAAYTFRPTIRTAP